MRARAFIMLAPLALVGCGAGDPEPGATSIEQPATTESSASTVVTSTPPTTTKPSTAAPETVEPEALGTVDVYTCQQFAGSERTGDAYDFLAAAIGESSVDVSYSTPGYVDAYGLGGLASVLTGQQESTEMLAAMEEMTAVGKDLAADIDSGSPVDAQAVLDALERVADICEGGGFLVDWN